MRESDGRDVTCIECKDAHYLVGEPYKRSESFICLRCRKIRFADNVLAELGGLPLQLEAALVFLEKVKELAQHYELVTAKVTR